MTKTYIHPKLKRGAKQDYDKMNSYLLIVPGNYWCALSSEELLALGFISSEPTSEEQKGKHSTGMDDLVFHPTEEEKQREYDKAKYGMKSVQQQEIELRVALEEKLTSQEADPAGDWIGKAYQYYANNIETEEMEDGEGFRVSIEKYMPKEERKPIITSKEVYKFVNEHVTRPETTYLNLPLIILGFLQHIGLYGEEETLSEGTPKETYEQYNERHENLYSNIRPEKTAETSYEGTSKKSLQVGSIPTMQKNSLTKPMKYTHPDGRVAVLESMAAYYRIDMANGYSTYEEKTLIARGFKVGETGEETTITKE